MTIADDVGNVFYLDMADETIHFNNGPSVALSVEQTALAANAFGLVVNADAQAALVQPPPPEEEECLPGMKPGEPGCYMDQSIPIFGDPTPLTTSLNGGDSSQTSSRVVVRRRTADSSLRDNGTSELGPSLLFYDGYSCREIARAMWEAKDRYRTRRTGFFNTLIAIVVSKPLEMTAKGPRIVLPNHYNAAVALQMAAAEKATAALDLRILGAMYTMNGCWNTPWPDYSAPSSGGGSHTHLNLVCRNEEWEISYDGGRTWQSVQVSVCEYEKLAQ